MKQRHLSRGGPVTAYAQEPGAVTNVASFDPAFLSCVAMRIVNEVPGINRLAYDYPSKPRGTIEWE